MAGVLAKIEPLYVPLDPPDGDDGHPAVQIGRTPAGKPIYQRTIIRAAEKKVPKVDPMTGEQEWGRHPNTNQPLYSKWKNVREERVQTFIMEADGAGNAYVRDYRPPSAEDLRRAEMEAKAAQFKDDLAREAAERGISAADLLARLMNSEAAEETQEDEEIAPAPVKRGRRKVDPDDLPAT